MATRNTTAAQEQGGQLETIKAGDRVWCSIERKVSLGVDSYESFNVHVGCSAEVGDGENRQEKLAELQGELIPNLLGVIDLLSEEFGLEK